MTRARPRDSDRPDAEAGLSSSRVGRPIRFARRRGLAPLRHRDERGMERLDAEVFGIKPEHPLEIVVLFGDRPACRIADLRAAAALPTVAHQQRNSALRRPHAFAVPARRIDGRRALAAAVRLRSLLAARTALARRTAATLAGLGAARRCARRAPHREANPHGEQRVQREHQDGENPQHESGVFSLARSASQLRRSESIHYSNFVAHYSAAIQGIPQIVQELAGRCPGIHIFAVR